MVKLTRDLINQSPQYRNPLKDRELDLRGNKITIIENLGATMDQFDSIDLSDNDIKKLDGFPTLKRLKLLIVCNNHISRFGESLGTNLPHLERLVLTNNNIQQLVDLVVLSKITSLRHLCMLRNPCVMKQYYRSFLIHLMPFLKVLDFQKVTADEIEKSNKLFEGINGLKLKNEILEKRGRSLTAEELNSDEQSKPTQQMIENTEAIKNAIKNAKTLDEVQHLETLLKSGAIPNSNSKPQQQTSDNDSD